MVLLEKIKRKSRVRHPCHRSTTPPSIKGYCPVIPSESGQTSRELRERRGRSSYFGSSLGMFTASGATVRVSMSWPRGFSVMTVFLTSGILAKLTMSLLRRCRSAALSRDRPSLHRLAAIDDHRMAAHEGGPVRAQPENSRGNFLGRSHPTDRLFGDDLGAAFGRAAGEAFHHRRCDVAGTDGIDAEVLRGVIKCRRLGESDHAVLRGGVRGAALDADHPRLPRMCSRSRRRRRA